MCKYLISHSFIVFKSWFTYVERNRMTWFPEVRYSASVACTVYVFMCNRHVVLWCSNDLEVWAAARGGGYRFCQIASKLVHYRRNAHRTLHSKKLRQYYWTKNAKINGMEISDLFCRRFCYDYNNTLTVSLMALLVERAFFRRDKGTRTYGYIIIYIYGLALLCSCLLCSRSPPSSLRYFRGWGRLEKNVFTYMYMYTYA